MQKSIIAAIVVAFTTGLFSTGAMAGPGDTPWVEKREHRQSVRIFNGVKNGSLNRRETGRLIRGQVRVHRNEYRFKSDGVVTPRERFRLHRQINRQSRRIRRGKHN